MGLFAKSTSAFGLLVIAAVVTGCAGARTKSLSGTERARLLVEIANGAILERDATGALQSLAEAETYDSKLPELYHTRAIAFAMKKDLKRAVADAERAVRLHPKYSEANNTYGKLLLDLGRYEEAQAPLTAAAEDPLYRDAYKAWTALGVLHYRRGNYPKARQALDKAIDGSPQLACIAYYYRGHVQLRESRVHDAIKDYDQATRRFCSSNSEAHLALGIAYEQGRQYDRAKRKFLQIQDLFPNTKAAEQAMSHLRYLP